jgi:putative PIN family toxin of toxin-antitoxin system
MKVVLDTNVVISVLLHQGPTRRIFELWSASRIKPLATQAILDEYVRVLHYPKFGFETKIITEILEENLLPWISKTGEYRGKLSHIPADKNDELFLRAALGGKASALVSGDIHLRALNGRYPFPILPPGDFLSRYFSKP